MKRRIRKESKDYERLIGQARLTKYQLVALENLKENGNQIRLKHRNRWPV